MKIAVELDDDEMLKMERVGEKEERRKKSEASQK